MNPRAWRTSAQLEQLKAAHEQALKQKAEELLQRQARYTADMRRVRSQFGLLETSVVQVKAVLLANKACCPSSATLVACVKYASVCVSPGGGNWRRSDSATKLLRAWWNYNATGEKQTLPWRDQPAFFETLQ
eukprot:scaffold125685_cov115-Phaeocystis_antarctica.AAC.2